METKPPNSGPGRLPISPAKQQHSSSIHITQTPTTGSTPTRVIVITDPRAMGGARMKPGPPAVTTAPSHATRSSNPPTSSSGAGFLSSPALTNRTIVIHPDLEKSAAAANQVAILQPQAPPLDSSAQNMDQSASSSSRILPDSHEQSGKNDSSSGRSVGADGNGGAVYLGGGGGGGPGPGGGSAGYVGGGPGLGPANVVASGGGNGGGGTLAAAELFSATSHHAIQSPYYAGDYGGGNGYYNTGQVGSGNGGSGGSYQQSLQAASNSGDFIIGQPSGSSGGSQAQRSDDDGTQHLSHTTRASPATIQWLLQNYETAEGVSLPRCTLYSHYLRHCQEHRLDPVNAASFGKLIRSVFLGLRTRRLGTRGNSKYHYYGIRIKPESPLNNMNEDGSAMAMRQQPMTQRKCVNSPPSSPVVHQGGTMQQRPPPAPLKADAPVAGNYSAAMPQGTPNVAPAGPTPTNNQVPLRNGVPSAASGGPTVANGGGQPGVLPGAGSLGDYQQFREHLGLGHLPSVPVPSVDKHFQSVLEEVRLMPAHVDEFCRAYQAHCKEILDLIQMVKFTEVEACWHCFWQPSCLTSSNGLDHLSHEDAELVTPAGFTSLQLYTMCTCGAVLDYICSMDLQFYQCLIEVLIPNVLRTIPNQLTQLIRNFAKGLEGSLRNALQGAPEELIQVKVKAVLAFAQTLRRYTSLSHLAQAARGVLQNQQQVQPMLTDLSRVNFKDIQDQAAFICQCDSALVEQLEMDFKSVLSAQRSLEEWAEWLERVVDRVLIGCLDSRSLISTAQQFLLKWSFYSSMVIRDLTLRSATSFGSFHLIRLLYDEYMFYLVEHRIARATGQTALGILAGINCQPAPTAGGTLMSIHDSVSSGGFFVCPPVAAHAPSSVGLYGTGVPNSGSVVFSAGAGGRAAVPPGTLDLMNGVVGPHSDSHIMMTPPAPPTITSPSELLVSSVQSNHVPEAGEYVSVSTPLSCITTASLNPASAAASTSDLMVQGNLGTGSRCGEAHIRLNSASPRDPSPYGELPELKRCKMAPS